LIGSELLISAFLENFRSLSQFPGGQMPVFPPADAHGAGPNAAASVASA